MSAPALAPHRASSASHEAYPSAAVGAPSVDPFWALAADYTRAQLALIGLARQLGGEHQHHPLVALDAIAPAYAEGHQQLTTLAALIADVTCDVSASRSAWTSAVAKRLAGLAHRIGLAPAERVLLTALVAIDAGLVCNLHLEPGARQSNALDAGGAALLATRDPRAPDGAIMAALRPYSPLCRAGVVALHGAAGTSWAQHTVRVADEVMDWLLLGVYPRATPGLQIYSPSASPDIHHTEAAILVAALEHPMVIIDDHSDGTREVLRAAAACMQRLVVELEVAHLTGELLHDAWLGALRIATTADAIIAIYLPAEAPGDPDRRPQDPARGDLAQLLQALPSHTNVVLIAQDPPAWAQAMPHRRFATANATPRFHGLATLVTNPASWQTAVFDAETRMLVQDVIDASRFGAQLLTTWGFADKLPYGRAVSALLAGPPGTGKTMSAALIANELGRPLYRVDLARVVSKYIGETEKQLQRVFDEAEATGAILLFDEADALFAKRTDVKSSNDRHANLEVNFLLQRLETYHGVILLTTNHEHLIDVAFKRRLRYRVQFAAPDLHARMALWGNIIPRQAELAPDVDIGYLAERFPLAGGHMLNALVRAASRALASGGAINQAHLIDSCQLEYAASGRV